MMLNCCFLLSQHEDVKTVKKLFEFHFVDGIHPSKYPILKNYSVFYFVIGNNI